jgi:hypothetical protein
VAPPLCRQAAPHGAMPSISRRVRPGRARRIGSRGTTRPRRGEAAANRPPVLDRRHRGWIKRDSGENARRLRVAKCLVRGSWPATGSGGDAPKMPRSDRVARAALRGGTGRCGAGMEGLAESTAVRKRSPPKPVRAVEKRRRWPSRQADSGIASSFFARLSSGDPLGWSPGPCRLSLCSNPLRRRRGYNACSL